MTDPKPDFIGWSQQQKKALGTDTALVGRTLIKLTNANVNQRIIDRFMRELMARGANIPQICSKYIAEHGSLGDRQIEQKEMWDKVAAEKKEREDKIGWTRAKRGY